MDLTEIKAAARKAAFARRKQAFDAKPPAQSGYLSEVLAGYRGVPLAGYMPIRTEINPLAAMAEAAAHGPVGVPVIQCEAQPLRMSSCVPVLPLHSPTRDGELPNDILERYFLSPRE